MSRGTIFLEHVTGKIKHRLQELEQTIREVKQDIHAMNDYYWENYTEMDEYGYENFDNQQALKLQVDANQENRKMRDRLERMLDAPFFGSVSFRFEDEEEDEIFYIGIGNFSERRGFTPLIYDWRAPVSSSALPVPLRFHSSRSSEILRSSMAAPFRIPYEGSIFCLVCAKCRISKWGFGAKCRILK